MHAESKQSKTQINEQNTNQIKVSDLQQFLYYTIVTACMDLRKPVFHAHNNKIYFSPSHDIGVHMH